MDRIKNDEKTDKDLYFEIQNSYRDQSSHIYDQ